MSIVVSEKNITTDIVSKLEKEISGLGAAELRQEAVASLKRLGLPGSKNEEYKHTPLTRLLEKNFNFSLENAPATDELPADYEIPGLTGNVLVFINGVLSLRHTKIVSDPKKVSVIPMREALGTNNPVVISHLGKIADHTTDAFAAWNTAAWKDGVFIHVPANTVVEEPVIIYHIHDINAGQVSTAVRNLVVVEKSSELTVLEKYDSYGTANGFSTTVTEGRVGENAGVTWFTIQNDKGNRYQFDHKQFDQTSSSRVNTYTFTLSGKAVRNNLNLNLDGQNIESHMYGLYLLGGDTLADNHTVVDHRQPNSFSNEMYKGIMDDSSRGVFNGKIYVRPNAQKTNAFQSNRNIILSEKAQVNTKPQLEIWADDVKCSHGCTSGQLDEEALFYLRARGISKESARAMMLYAFAAELLETIKHPGIKEFVDSIIGERLHKTF